MLPEIIIKTDNLKPYKNGWYKGFIRFPKNEKNNSIIFWKEDEKQDLFFLTGIRHYDNDSTIDNYLNQINGNLQYFQKGKLTITELIRIENFSNLLFIPVEYTIISRYYPENIHNKQVQVMPIYKNEISGKETPSKMKELFRRNFSPIDWDRRRIGQ